MSGPDDFARFQRIEGLIVERLRSENVPVFKMNGEWFLQAVEDESEWPSISDDPIRHQVCISSLARLIAEDGR